MIFQVVAIWKESLVEQVDDGLLLAERLSDILSKKDEDKQRAIHGVEGALSLRPDFKIQRKTVKLTGTMPTCREELRERYALMGNAWELIRLRLPSRPLLRDYSPAIFNETLLNFLFGDKVFFLIFGKPRCFIYSAAHQALFLALRILCEREGVQKRTGTSSFINAGNLGDNYRPSLLSEGFFPAHVRGDQCHARGTWSDVTFYFFGFANLTNGWTIVVHYGQMILPSPPSFPTL